MWYGAMKNILIASALAALSSSFYAGSAAANDFPTQARVEFVFGCMGERGGQSYNTLYACVCMADEIASQMSYREYVSAEMLSFLYRTPGERGGIFRDAAPQSRKRIKALEAARRDAEAACTIPGVASNLAR